MTSGLLCGGIAVYPLINLADSVASTHRFESRYFDRLVGGLPGENNLYKRRSVAAEELDDIPILIMHGDSDPVVDHRQVVKFVDDANSLGRSVEFMLFQGEGHGFSSPRAVESEFLAYERFLAQISAKLRQDSS
jgi:dipeptidyl aminopeptidase/acylaminoacyl peptidase